MTIILLIFVVVFVAFILIYNRFIQLKNLMREAESGVEVQLKRRHDLIPNLIETVKGYQQFERSVLEDVTRLRGQINDHAQMKDKVDLETQISRSLKTLFAVAENYPDLKANQNFLQLHKTLVDVEGELQMARRYYNGTVRNYNILTESFPSNIIGGIFQFKPFAYFEIEYATERQTPDVKF